VSSENESEITDPSNAELVPEQPQETGEANAGQEPCDACVSDTQSIQEAIGDVTYEWTISNDTLVMSPNAQNIFDFSDSAYQTTGKGFAACQDYGNEMSRYATVFDGEEVDQGRGVPFQIEYLIKPHGRDKELSIWVEDTGRWFAGTDGRPAKVIGIMRRSDTKHARDEAQKYLSEFDAETGLVIRNALEAELEKSFTLSAVSGENFAFCLAAIDNLSVLNESYGYEVADQIIPIVASRLKSVMRAGDMIGRYAGNKFGIILNNCDDTDVAIACDRLLHAVSEEPVETFAGAINVSISIGSVLAPKTVSNSKKARAGAEQALREAKGLISTHFVIYEPCAQQESERRRNIQFVDKMLSALNERRLCLAYQPIVDAFSLEPVYHECLLRMRNSQEKLISAGEFIPHAESLGLANLIDQRVLEMALASLEEMPDSSLAINVSGKTVNDNDWLEYLTSYLSQNSNMAQRIMIEITETAALHEVGETRKFVSTLHEYGCQVAIDDFGAGYTSFKNLKDLEVDIVKIDGHFIENMASSADDQFFVRTLIDLAKNFNMKTVAEWVTDQETVDLLRAWGVDYFQGNVFGHPDLALPHMGPLQEAAPEATVSEPPHDTLEDTTHSVEI
jgi:diguanylate cyclase (GGDEF)-like protein